MRRVWKVLVPLAVIALAAGGFLYYRVMYKPHRDIRAEQGIRITATDLAQLYASNEKKADSLYLDKAIEVTGTVGDTASNQQGRPVITLATNDPMVGIRCTLAADAQMQAILPGQTIAIKGKCTGYLMDVTLIDSYPLP